MAASLEKGDVQMRYGQRTHRGRLATRTAAAALALGLVGAPAVLGGTGGNGPIGGETRFNLDLPDGVTLKATKGAIKQGPSKVVMENLFGRFDPSSGVGRIELRRRTQLQVRPQPRADRRVRDQVRRGRQAARSDRRPADQPDQGQGRTHRSPRSRYR